MARTRVWLLIFCLYLLIGCTSVLAHPLTTSTTIKPTEQIVFPTITKYASNTPASPTSIPIPCPPYLETKLPNPDIPENYIGKVFNSRPYPNGLVMEYGGLIDFLNDDLEIHYAFEEIINTSTDQRMLWFERELCKDEKGSISFEIIDILVLPFNPDDIVMEPEYCSYNGEIDPEIFALGSRSLNLQGLKNVSRAWRANRQTGKIEEISVDGIECLAIDVENP